MKYILLILMLITTPAQAQDASAKLTIKGNLIYQCPDGQLITRDICDTMTLDECCLAYELNEVVPQAGLEPIDMMSQPVITDGWVERGDVE